MIKVLLADDHQIVTDGIKALLEPEPDLQIVGTAANGVEVLQFLKEHLVDVLLLDLYMPEMDGIETIEAVRRLFPELHIVMLTTNDEGSIIASLFKKGISGYLLKNASKAVLIQGIKDAFAGKTVIDADLTTKMIQSMSGKSQLRPGDIPKITKRELEVMQLIAQEYTTQQIADALFLSTNTVATHRRNLFVKMDVKNSVGLIKKAVDWGMI